MGPILRVQYLAISWNQNTNSKSKNCYFRGIWNFRHHIFLKKVKEYIGKQLTIIWNGGGISDNPPFFLKIVRRE